MIGDAKKADPEADVSGLEAEIDQLVYSLYGLTREEIAISKIAGKKKQLAGKLPTIQSLSWKLGMAR